MEELLAEAMDVNPAARAAFLDEYMVQAPIPDPALVPLFARSSMLLRTIASWWTRRLPACV